MNVWYADTILRVILQREKCVLNAEMEYMHLLLLSCYSNSNHCSHILFVINIKGK